MLLWWISDIYIYMPYKDCSSEANHFYTFSPLLMCRWVRSGLVLCAHETWDANTCESAIILRTFINDAVVLWVHQPL